MNLGYHVYSYNEQYESTNRMQIFEKVGGFSHTLTEFRKLDINSVNFNNWIPWEDLWITKTPINIVDERKR